MSWLHPPPAAQAEDRVRSLGGSLRGWGDCQGPHQIQQRPEPAPGYQHGWEGDPQVVGARQWQELQPSPEHSLGCEPGSPCIWAYRSAAASTQRRDVSCNWTKSRGCQRRLGPAETRRSLGLSREDSGSQRPLLVALVMVLGDGLISQMEEPLKDIPGPLWRGRNVRCQVGTR